MGAIDSSSDTDTDTDFDPEISNIFGLRYFRFR